MKRIPLTISIILLLCCYANAQSDVEQGVVNDGEYTNPALSFRFKFPKDWVVHGEATKERIRELGKEKIAESGASRASTEVALKNTYQLLTIFHYALGTPGVTFNPSILVIAERVDHAPGIKNGKDYLLNVRALLTRTPGYQVLQKEPVEYHFGETQFFRDNYAVEVNGVHMVQSHFATVRYGYALIFAFMGEDQASVDEMAKAIESFDSIPPVRSGITTVIDSPPPHKPN